jgi:hypothetical protein
MNRVASRTAQYPLFAEFVVNVNEWVYDSVSLAAVTLGSTPALSTDPLQPGLSGPAANTITFDAIPMPVGAVIVGGEVIVDTAVTGSTAYTVSVGIAGSLTALASAVSGTAAAGTRTALTLTAPLLSNAAGQNLRLTVAYTVANATAGKVRVRVQYTIDGRGQEVQIS